MLEHVDILLTGIKHNDPSQGSEPEMRNVTPQHRAAARLINVKIEEGQEGLLYATSADLIGLFVAAPDLPALLEEIPEVIKAMFAAQGREVNVHRVERPVAGTPDHDRFPWVAVPVHIAAHALGARG
jgi:hypothetical protein